MSGVWVSVCRSLKRPSWLQDACLSSSPHIYSQGRNSWEGPGRAAHVRRLHGAFRKPLADFTYILLARTVLGGQL